MSIETPIRLPHLGRVQSLRGLAAMGVLLGHMYVVETKRGGATLLGEWAHFGQAGVDLFFVISGFIMVYVTSGTPRGLRAPSPFLWRRVTRIYPLYWIVSAAVLAVWLWRPGMVFASNPDPDIVKSFLLWPDDSLPLLSVGWTLIHEMWFYLVFAVLLIAPRHWLPGLLLGWAGAVLATSAVIAPETVILRLVSNPLTLEFIAGGIFGMIWISGRRGHPGLPTLLLLVVLVVLVSGPVRLIGITGLLDHHGFRVATLGVAALAVFTARMLWSRPASRTGQWLGDISYSLYLTHILTLSVVGRLWQVAAQDGVWDNALALIVMVAASLLVAHLTYILIERPLIRWFRRRRGSHRTAERASG